MHQKKLFGPQSPDTFTESTAISSQLFDSNNVKEGLEFKLELSNS